MLIMLTSWVKNIIFVVLFAVFLELLLPTSSMQRFVRVIVGIFIMLAIITPVIEVIQHPLSPVPISTFANSSLNSTAIMDEATSFVHGQENLSKEIYKKELAQQMQVMVTKLEGVADARVIVDTEVKGKISGVMVYITPGIIGNKTQVKKVLISDDSLAGSELDAELTNKVKKIIIELYQVPKEIVVVKRLHS